jgi:hypothetical protein
MLAFAGLAHAQSDTPSAPRTLQTLINSGYLPYSYSNTGQTRSLRTGPLPAGLPSATGDAIFHEDFRPLEFIQRQYIAVLGREPTQEEAKFWLARMQYTPRRDIANEIRTRPPFYGVGHYDPAMGQDYDPGYGSRFFPDPASLNFRDPSGPYFKSPYFPNYEYRRPIRAFYLGAQG